MKKKFFAVFLLTTIAPLIIIFYLLSSIYYSANSTLFSLLFTIPFLSCVYILRQNYSTGVKSMMWYVIATVFGAGSLLSWYLLHSLSNVGF